LLEKSNLCVVTLNSDGNIDFINDHLLNKTGYTRQEVFGKNWFRIFIPPQDRNEIKNVFNELMDAKMHDQHTNDILTKKGKQLQIHWNNAILRDANGRVLMTLSIGLDVSEIQRTEETLRRQLQEVTALHGIASAGTESKSIDELIERTTKFLGGTLYSDNFGILIYCKETDELKNHASYRGVSPEWKEKCVKSDIGITG